MNTIQERLLYLCKKEGLSPEKLSKKVGLHRTYIRRILGDPKRQNISAMAAEKLSFATKVSRSWIVSGVGAPGQADVPEQPPAASAWEPNERNADWPDIAARAMSLDRTLDWAIMGVGEKPVTALPGVLTAYAVLAEAERFRAMCTDDEERMRLDQKARRFRKVHFPAPMRQSQQMRRSSPPKM